VTLIADLLRKAVYAHESDRSPTASVAIDLDHIPSDVAGAP